MALRELSDIISPLSVTTWRLNSASARNGVVPLPDTLDPLRMPPLKRTASVATENLWIFTWDFVPAKETLDRVEPGVESSAVNEDSSEVTDGAGSTGIMSNAEE